MPEHHVPEQESGNEAERCHDAGAEKAEVIFHMELPIGIINTTGGIPVVIGPLEKLQLNTATAFLAEACYIAPSTRPYSRETASITV